RDWSSDVCSSDLPLTKGMVALIDASDEHLIAPHEWIASKSANAFYARAAASSPFPGLQMHRLLLDAPDGLQVDHINGDTLDNRRCNLELVDAAENMRRWAKRLPNKASRFTGVYRSRNGRSWYVRIYHDGKHLSVR